MKKKLIAWLLVICMAISLLPAAALADTAAKSGKCGDNVTWTLSNDGTLTISGKGKMYEPKYYGYTPWEAHKNLIVNVVIEEGVENVFSGAFSQHKNLKTVSLPSTLKSIGGEAFEFTAIKNIIIPEKVESIGTAAFTGSSLEQISIPNTVTEMGYSVFRNCKNLTNAALPNDITELDGMFDGCTNLKKVTLGDKIESIQTAFKDCKNLEEINLPDTLKIVGFHAFSGCTSLKNIELPEGLETISMYAFYGCSFKNVKIPDSVKYVGEYAFYGSSFDKVNISKDMVIEECSFGYNVNAYYVDEENRRIVMQDGTVWDADKNILIACGKSQCKEGYILGSLNRIGAYAFANCTNLKEVFFIGDAPAFGDKAFLNCNIIIDYPKGNSTWSGKTSYTLGGKIKWTPYEVVKPNAPKVTASTDAASGKPSLKWGSDENAAVYCVYRATSKNSDYYLVDAVEGTKYVDTDTTPGKTYYYIVTAVNINGDESDNSAIKSITCDCARPVVSITTNASSGKPSLKWNAVDGAAKYEVYRATSKNGTYTKMYTTTSISYTNSSAVAGTTYYYKVKAICGKSSYGNSAYSVVKSIKCTPAAPSLSISRVNGKPKLSWNAVSGATKYWIYRSTDGKNFKYYDSTTKTSYTNSGAASGAKYYYKVKAVTVVNGKSVASSYSYAKSLVCTPATPNVSITSANGKPKLSWNAVSGATKYWIYRSTDGKNFKYYDSTTKTTYTNNSTTVGTRYYYKVKAVVVDNGTSYASAFSSAKSMTVRAAAPTLKTSAPEGTPSLSWNAVNGATKYWVYRSTDGKEFKYYDSTTKTAYTNKSVDAGKTYYYKVKAVNVVNGTSYASGFSNSVSVLVK